MNKNNLMSGLITVCLIFMIIFLSAMSLTYRAETEIAEAEVVRLRETVAGYAEFAERQNISELAEENLIGIREKLPSDFEQESFTDEIYRAADRNGITVNSVEVGEVSQVEENFYRQAIKVQFDVEYIQLVNFLREVSDGRRFATLNSLTFEENDCAAEFFIYAEKIGKE